MERKSVTVKELPALAVLDGRLSYDPETGALTWRSAGSYNSRIKVGAEAGCLDKRGYRCLKLNGTMYWAHRIIWKMMTGKDPVGLIDHQNGNPSDNRWANLREASHSENVINSRQPSHSAAPYKGLTWHKGDRKWQVSITVDGRKRYVGSYDTPEAARDAYERVARQEYGAFARFA